MAKKRKSAKRRYHCTRRKVGVDGKKHCAKYAGKSPAKGRRCGIMGINRLGKPVCLRYKGAHKTETRKRSAARRQSRVMQQASKLFSSLGKPRPTSMMQPNYMAL